MTAGRILRFDWTNGYGFIVPDDGGDDVFLHASEIREEDRDLVRTGAPVEFLAMRGARGVKAAEVRFVGSTNDDDARTSGATDAAESWGSVEEDADYEALSEAEFTREVTELLLRAAPSLTAAQIIDARRGLVAFAHDKGWIES